MSRSQRAVQAGHAIEEWHRDELCRAWRQFQRYGELEPRRETGTLVYLKVSSIKELEELYAKCNEASAFREPFWDNQMTAFACLTPIPEFESLKLL